MQIQIYAGGKNWIVDENALVNWLVQNAVQNEQPTKVVREIIDREQTGRVLLNENG